MDVNETLRIEREHLALYEKKLKELESKRIEYRYCESLISFILGRISAFEELNTHNRN